MNIRVASLLLLVGSCVESAPARDFEARITYNGVRSRAVIEYPAHSFTDDPADDDPPVHVAGTVRDGDAPIARASLVVDDDSRVYEIAIIRNADDSYAGEPNVLCRISEVEVNHAVRCLYSIRTCSIVLEELDGTR